MCFCWCQIQFSNRALDSQSGSRFGHFNGGAQRGGAPKWDVVQSQWDIMWIRCANTRCCDWWFFRLTRRSRSVIRQFLGTYLQVIDIYCFFISKKLWKISWRWLPARLTSSSAHNMLCSAVRHSPPSFVIQLAKNIFAGPRHLCSVFSSRIIRERL